MQIYNIKIDENQKEVTNHGRYEFPIEIYESVLEKNVLGFINWHWHYELQLCLVTKGTVDFYVCDNKYTLNEGEGVFVNSECIHMAKPVAKPENSYICIDFNPKLISSFQGSLIEQKYVNPYISSKSITAILLKKSVDWQKFILDRISIIHSKFINRGTESENSICEFDIYLDLISIWKEIIENIDIKIGKVDKTKTNDEDRLKLIFEYIHKNYMNKITLNDIVSIVHLSKSECCHLFKRNVKCTIFEYIQDYRINKSIEFLKNTSMSISQISYEVGFCSTSYYCEIFKKKTNLTPNEYRTNKFKND